VRRMDLPNTLKISDVSIFLQRRLRAAAVFPDRKRELETCFPPPATTINGTRPPTGIGTYGCKWRRILAPVSIG
ncbi:MAG: hypothetical protein ACRD22_20730, partial [Terriglobia bacterium]